MFFFYHRVEQSSQTETREPGGGLGCSGLRRSFHLNYSHVQMLLLPASVKYGGLAFPSSHMAAGRAL